MHRLFVAIRPPEPIRDLLLDAMDDSADFRWQSEEQLLRFRNDVLFPAFEKVFGGLPDGPREVRDVTGVFAVA